jgi:osmotically-inducible protein OsmY
MNAGWRKESTNMMTHSTKTETNIEKDVESELRNEAYLHANDITVKIDRGIVTLAGSVPNLGERRMAELAAYRVHGVYAVANDLRVVLPPTTFKPDLTLATAVRHALAGDARVPEELIHTTVDHGWVTMEGTVATGLQRLAAVEVIRRLPRVRGITNALAVQRQEASPASIHAEVEAALARQSERIADQVQIHVKDGTVTVHGRVQTWREKHAILGVAGHAPGIKHLKDELHIDPAA